jgi:hypothetical protein
LHRSGHEKWAQAESLRSRLLGHCVAKVSFDGGIQRSARTQSSPLLLRVEAQRASKLESEVDATTTLGVQRKGVA